MDSIQIKTFLRKIELFQDLNDHDCELLAQNFEVQTYAQNSLLFVENNVRKYLYIITDGEVELFKKTPFGDEKRLTIFSKLDFLGEGAFIDDSPHTTSARATLNTTALLLSKEKFYEIAKSEATLPVKIYSRMARVIFRRMQFTNTRVINLAAQYQSGRTRTEHDLLGDRDVPNEVYYGVQTLRGLENFNISGVALSFYPVLIEALAMVKMAAAKANYDLGLLSKPILDAIVQACHEIITGKYHGHFVIDMIQGGAGTSTNMNANEVIANRALEILGYERGDYKYCHPNNHVNLSQSTNDAYPTSVKIAIINSNKKLVEV
ncbi:MAG: lyase family protein, partial [Melioribacteraceae bacterium]